MGDNADVRLELIRRIEARRASINAFLRRVRPRSTRLANISIISSAAAAAFTAGPAFGGVTFAEAVQRIFSLSGSSIVWRVLCLVAMLVSLVAAISAHLNKSQDMAAQLSAAEACNAELEGLQTLVEFAQLSVGDAAELYQKYITKIPFVEEGPANP
jgi:MFS family permease